MSTTTYAQRTITVILAAAIPMSMTTGFADAAPVQHTSPPSTAITAPAPPLSAALPSDRSDEEIARALERIATELERALASLPPDQRDNPHAVRDALQQNTAHDRLNPVGVAACIAALGEFIITTGIPAAKIVKIIWDAKKIYGSLVVAAKNWKESSSLPELGEEAATILQKIIGIDGVIAKCSNI